MDNLAFGQPLILTPKGQFAGGVHREKLRPGILKNTAHILGCFIERKPADVFAIQQDLSGQLPLIVIGDQPIYQAGQRGFSAAGPATQENYLSVRNFKIDLLQTACVFPACVAKIDIL